MSPFVRSIASKRSSDVYTQPMANQAIVEKIARHNVTVTSGLVLFALIELCPQNLLVTTFSYNFI